MFGCSMMSQWSASCRRSEGVYVPRDCVQIEISEVLRISDATLGTMGEQSARADPTQVAQSNAAELHCDTARRRGVCRSGAGFGRAFHERAPDFTSSTWVPFATKRGAPCSRGGSASERLRRGPATAPQVARCRAHIDWVAPGAPEQDVSATLGRVTRRNEAGVFRRSHSWPLGERAREAPCGVRELVSDSARACSGWLRWCAGGVWCRRRWSCRGAVPHGVRPDLACRSRRLGGRVARHAVVVGHEHGERRDAEATVPSADAQQALPAHIGIRQDLVTSREVAEAASRRQHGAGRKSQTARCVQPMAHPAATRSEGGTGGARTCPDPTIIALVRPLKLASVP